MTTDEAKDEMMAMMRARRFQTFQSSINAISSQPPDFDEVVQLFGLTIELFGHRTLRTLLSAGSTAQKAASGADFNGAARDLKKNIRALPLNDPETAKIIVVTSYTTAAARFPRHWMVDKETQKRYPVMTLTRTECEEESMAREAYITASAIAAELNEERSEEKSYELRVKPGLFGTSIWDEAHWPKTVKTIIFWIAAKTSTAAVKATKTEDEILPIEHYDHIRQVLTHCSGNYLKADNKARAELVTALDHEAYTKLMDDHDKEGAIV
ncbi:hypothetical protein LTR74_017775 [Friedmanniomyces endolithicus]|nr:hypothetical protein LTR74_017775 [Friedmanniomyces endolithicus]